MKAKLFTNILGFFSEIMVAGLAICVREIKKLVRTFLLSIIIFNKRKPLAILQVTLQSRVDA